jgi:hypothetical protein
MSCWSAAGELAVSATSPATATATATTAAALAAARLRTPAIAKSRLRKRSFCVPHGDEKKQIFYESTNFQDHHNRDGIDRREEWTGGGRTTQHGLLWRRGGEEPSPQSEIGGTASLTRALARPRAPCASAHRAHASKRGAGYKAPVRARLHDLPRCADSRHAAAAPRPVLDHQHGNSLQQLAHGPAE